MQLSLEKQLQHSVFCRKIDRVEDIHVLQELLKDLFLVSQCEKQMFTDMLKNNPQDFNLDTTINNAPKE